MFVSTNENMLTATIEYNSPQWVNKLFTYLQPCFEGRRRRLRRCGSVLCASGGLLRLLQRLQATGQLQHQAGSSQFLLSDEGTTKEQDIST